MRRGPTARHGWAARARGALLAAVLLTAALSAGGCDGAGPPADEDLLVVQAFFEPGRAPGAVVLRRSQPLQGTREAARGADAAGATGAHVRVKLEGRTLVYEPDAQQAGRYVPPAGAAPVAPRTDVALTVDWRGQHLAARGHVPPPIEIDDVEIDVPEAPVEGVLLDSLRLDTLGTGAEQGYIYPVEVTVRWRPAAPAARADSATWIRVQLRPEVAVSSVVLDFFLQPEAVFREAERPPGADGRRTWTGVYAVGVSRESDPLPPHRLRVALVRSDAAYARFAATQGDPERREPVSNVEGGLGIVAGIAVDSLSLRVE